MGNAPLPLVPLKPGAISDELDVPRWPKTPQS